MRRLWIVVAVVLAVGAGYSIYHLFFEDSASEGTTLSPVMRRDLAARVVRTVEDDPAAERAVLPVEEVLCAARVFGTEPLRLDSVRNVDTVYARVYCVEVRPDHTAGERAVLPVAVHFDDEVKVERPRDGSAHARDIDKIFPSRLRAAARRDDPAVGDLEAEVERRLEALPRSS